MTPIIIKRIKIEKKVLKSIIEELKIKKGLTQKRISITIGSNIVNSLNRGDGISESSFKILESLVQKKIPIKNSITQKRYLYMIIFLSLKSYS